MNHFEGFANFMMFCFAVLLIRAFILQGVQNLKDK